MAGRVLPRHQHPEQRPDARKTRVARRVQENGRAYLATVAVRGSTAPRACLCTYRTTTAELDLLLREVLHAADADHRQCTVTPGQRVSRPNPGAAGGRCPRRRTRRCP
ncbi:hypothetical protein ACIRPK_07520 [Kitasatospora sp. NPDC101801]|uniref:hypothetical protein n=1 Tax=Kitasatospora sp. NPDC101801 TaxID=3364103 RepID=UPI0037F7DF66